MTQSRAPLNQSLGTDDIKRKINAPSWLNYFNQVDTTLANHSNAVSSLQGQTENLANQAANIVANGPTMATQLPTYANNTAATAAGLVAGTLYRTANGTVQVVY